MGFRSLTLLIALFAVPACSDTSEPLEVSEDVTAVANDSSGFATDLFARLRQHKGKNLFCSPYSISSALAMTFAGAEGETKAQMARALHFNMPEENLHSAFGELHDLLIGNESTPGIELKIANRLWGQEGTPFEAKFLDVVSENHGTEMGLLDFNDAESARATINSWIEENTNRKIQNLLPPGVLGRDSRLVLTNAIYFKGRWTEEFRKSATTNAPFHVSDSEDATVPMMHQTQRLRYSAADNVQILEMSFGEDEGVSMLILLPNKKDGLDELEERLTSDNLQKWFAGLESQEVSVELPRFKIRSQFSLGDVLTSMGMPLAFARKADFSGMCTVEELFISAVIHSAVVDVNEEGAEAIAVTVVEAAKKEKSEFVEFHADHPFVFLIRDNRTQCILFLGRLANPEE